MLKRKGKEPQSCQRLPTALLVHFEFVSSAQMPNHLADVNQVFLPMPEGEEYVGSNICIILWVDSSLLKGLSKGG